MSGMDGGPVYRTVLHTTQGGRETRAIEWAYPLGEWELASGIKEPQDYDAVRDLFRMARGRAIGFRLRDWADYACGHESGVVTLLGPTLGQLVRRYGQAPNAEDRIITKPVVGTVAVRRVRAGVPSAIAATIDHATGGVVFSGHLEGDTYTWAGEFDVPARFDTDTLRTRQTGPADRGDFGGRPLLSVDALPLREIRVLGAVL